MSENIENNVFFAARAFPAGSFHFVELAGPPLGAGMGLEAVGFLQRCGMEFTREGLRRSAHLFGWLWEWMDQWEARGKSVQLRNTDGEELLWHTASFSVADPDQTRQTLMQRDDIEYDEQADELVWNKPAGPDSRMMGETPTPLPGRQEMQPAPIPIESVPPKPKVARNAPCPCGSGRKYKKCCGREDVSARG
jgi:hypothetical protein